MIGICILHSFSYSCSNMSVRRIRNDLSDFLKWRPHCSKWFHVAIKHKARRLLVAVSTSKIMLCPINYFM